MGIVTSMNISSKIPTAMFKNTCHFHFHCPNFLTERNNFLNKITYIDSNTLNKADGTIIKTLLFGNSKYSNEINLQILNASINLILTSKRFDEPLMKFLAIKISYRSISVSLSLSLKKFICQFEHKLYFFILLPFSLLFQIFLACFFFLPGYWKYKIVSGNCNIL